MMKNGWPPICAAFLLAFSGPCLAQQADIAIKLSAILEDNFVLPETAKQYAERLRARSKEGAYAGLDTAALAQTLTDDLQKVAPDRHLRVQLLQPGTLTRQNTSAATAPPALENAQWIRPNVAYLKINAFSSAPADRDRLDVFLRAYKDAKALIIDVRDCPGGAMDMIDQLNAYLYPQVTDLLAMETRTAATRRIGDPIAQIPTAPTVASDDRVVRHMHRSYPAADAGSMPRAKVFLLVSARSASAAEHFAFALKRTHRATIVGEKTRGAGHFGISIPLDDRLQVFVPVGRTYDPDTGADWEAVGVTPDLPCIAESALETALGQI